MSIPSYQSTWSDSQVINSAPLPQPSYLQSEPARLFQCEPQLSTLPHTTFAALKPQAAATSEPGSKQPRVEGGEIERKGEYSWYVSGGNEGRRRREGRDRRRNHYTLHIMEILSVDFVKTSKWH
ncbi:hypothetical protein PAMP_009645 [Pampus punctatissimus]